MEIILLDNVENLGGVGDRVKVKSGYARNFLIPQGKATPATVENVARMEAHRAELERKAAEEISQAEGRAELVRQLGTISIAAKLGSEGKLFGSVGTVDIAEACEAAGVLIERSEVRLSDGPIKVAGDHQVDIHLHSDLNVPLNVVVTGQAMTEEEQRLVGEPDEEGEAEADPEPNDAD